MSFVAIGPTEVFVDAFGVRYDEHCKGWRWHLYMQGNAKREAALKEELRKMIAERKGN